MLGQDYISARQLLLNFKGHVPVIVKEIKTNKTFRSSDEFCVKIDEDLLIKLKEILGADNVKYID